VEPAKKPNIDTTQFCMVGGASLFPLKDKILTTQSCSRKVEVKLCSLKDTNTDACEKTINVLHDVWIGTIDGLVAKFRRSLELAANVITRQDVDAGVSDPPKEWAETEQTQRVLAEAGVKGFAYAHLPIPQ